MKKYLSIVMVIALLTGYAIGSVGDDQKTSYISLKSYVFDTHSGEPVVADNLKAQFNDGDNFNYVLVKFPGPLTAQNYNSLKRTAENIYTYLPYFAYLVKLDNSKFASVQSATGASWVGLYHPAYKISSDIAAVKATDQRELYIVMIHVFPDANLERVVERIQELGVPKIEGYGYNPFFSRIRILLSPERVVALREEIAKIKDVFWLTWEPKYVFYNDTTIWVGQSGVSGGQTTPVFSHGIYGEGQIISALDTGIDADSCYFWDPAKGVLPPRNECNGGTVVDLTQRKVIAVDFLWSTECSGGISNTEWDTQDHGTHVAGIMTGDNFANPKIHDPGDGMAPGALLVMQDCGFQTNNCADCPGIGCPVIDLNPIFLQPYNQGVRIHSNSWGDNENAPVQNNYTTASEDVDQFMWNHPEFLLFFAAGNSGPGDDSVGSPSTAKSCVSVGATARGTSAESLASFSSWGQTDDNRIKPEVTIPGSNIISANNDGSVTTYNCNTQSMSGTSMACPAAAGLTALIRQYYTEGWHPSGAKNPPDGFTPTAAMLRASVVNSAQNMTGVTSPIPSNPQGWGRILLDNLMYWTGETRKLFVTDDSGFPTGSTSSKTWQFNVTSSSVPFKVTIAWTDYPSTPAASPHINNDIDLTVTAPGAVIYRGNVFSGGQSTTGGSADRLNTLEQVLRLTPATGTYTITVQAYNIPNGPQPFALVVTGAITSPTPHASHQSNAVTDTCASGGPGNNNGIIDPGESVQVAVTLINDGIGNLTNINGTLSTATSGVTINDNNASFPNIPNGGTGTSIAPHFTYSVSNTFTCGNPIDFSLALAYTEGSNNTSFQHTVGNMTTTTLLNEDWETGSDGWSMTGLWHLTTQAAQACMAEPYPSPVTVAYYGQDSTCNFNTGATTSGNLDRTTPVPGITASSQLSFMYVYQGEGSTSYDRAYAYVSPDGTTWTQVWTVGSAAQLTWISSGNLSLATWAGQSIRVRFRFDSVDGTLNTYLGFAVDNVQVSGSSWNCNVCNVVVGPPGRVLSNLNVAKSGANLNLTWVAPGGTCTTTGYGVYRGTLPLTAYNHASLSCAVTGTSFSTAQDTGSYYFLVVPLNTTNEGSYGTDSAGSQIPPASTPCKPQLLTACN
ncbi:MAG: hypothetical protein A2Y62_06220 [Candidatus Fischerbacteria bacterium RBG_13_37_8]|uniref:Peptidase S8/S53 domain-containing protein n=1 Tax=Candidatus Fischerbacteria bacterium RBG_13_37_8 TaxID=1817863 RepID=A0A1F5VVE3_9BACT|nr:MAG: hypothetical protein A2Y62_06220 [Candidatus Fischerbacteria bacterium RBG_13_37_8]